MMDSKPLSYESLKNVLLYMEANVRFQISHRCPAIRKTEKIVPLNIENLEFENMQLTVNKTKYKIGIFRKYHDNEVPNLTQIENDRGGVDYDLDRFGFGSADVYNVIMPGDVLIKDSTTRTFIHNEERRQELERQLVEWESQRDRQQNQLPGSNDESMQQVSLEDLKMRIDYLRIDNFLQLTITSPSGKRIERFDYNKKLYEAQKYLSSVLFGKRLPMVQVKHLNISFDHMVIRLPLGVKFNIRELETRFSLAKIYEALRPIVDESSYPLEVLSVLWVPQILENPDHEMIKNAKQLCIDSAIPSQYITSFQYRNVHFRSYSISFIPENYIILIRIWLETCREVGTVYTFGIKEKEVCTKILKSIKNQFDDAISGEKFIILPMSGISKLEVSYKAVTVDEYFKEPWLLKIEVCSVWNKRTTS